MKLKGICVALATLSLVGLVGCNSFFVVDDNNLNIGEEPLPEATRNYFYVMNAVASITIPDAVISQNEEGYTQLLTETDELLSNIDNSLSATKSGSYVSLFNDAEAGERVEVDKIFYDVLSIAKSMYTLTEGYYNPAVYYSVAAYGFNGGVFPTTTESFPTNDTCQKYITLAESFGEISLEVDSGKYYATKPQTTIEVEGETLSLKLDLGGIGKGYAADEVDKLFTKYSFNYGLFNFGLSSISLRKYYSGNNTYNLGLVDPRGDGTYFSIRVKDIKVSSSGDHENCYFIDGKRYSHIINPKTARPIDNGMMSATVLGGSAAENDALTTAILAMGRAKATTFMAALTDRQVIFSFEDSGYKFSTNVEVYKINNPSYVKV